MSDRDHLPGGARTARGPRPDAQPTVELAVLVVGYRRPDLLARCLRSVDRHLPGHRILVWDNSVEDSPDRRALVAERADVSWQLSPVNVGFAAAVNALAEQAGDADLLLLNPDAELTGPLTDTRAALSEWDVAAVAPHVIDPRARRTTWDVAHRRGGLVTALVAHSGYAGRLRRTPLSDLYAGAPRDVGGYLTGGCLAVSRAAWRDVGPFDEEFFLYGEEADWQARARQAGWRLVLADEHGAEHAGHGTVAGDPLAGRRSRDLLRANIALALEHERGVHVADTYLAGTSALDRVQRSRRRERSDRPRRARPSVVLTINRLGYGGAERHHVLLAAELQRRGHDVVLACMQRLGPLVREVGTDVRVVRQPWWAPAVDLGPGPAVVVSGDTNTETGFAALWRRAGRDRRWLAAAHIPPDPAGPTYGRALAAVMARADGFVALSPTHAAEVGAHQRVARRTFIAPNGVPDAAPDLARARVPGRPLHLVMLSRIVESKNPHLLVDALDDLRHLDWELSIFGDGPDRGRLEALTPEPLSARVHWRGWSPGPDDALRDCDLVCVPSGTEAFPLVVVESMARGLPVLASAVCSVPDMLDHGRAGLLVHDVSVEGWRAALQDALTRPQDLPALGAAGQERMRALYTVEAMADAYEAAIDAVLRDGR